eukprot:364979-Chlamydomonas_euryale.AAC.7
MAEATPFSVAAAPGTLDAALRASPDDLTEWTVEQNRQLLQTLKQENKELKVPLFGGSLPDLATAAHRGDIFACAQGQGAFKNFTCVQRSVPRRHSACVQGHGAFGNFPWRQEHARKHDVAFFVRVTGVRMGAGSSTR